MILSLLLACAEPAPQPVAEPIVEAPVAAEAVAGPSIYEMDLDLLDQNGMSRELDMHRGHPVLISMFYSSCPMACPMLIAQIQGLEAQLDPAVRADVRVLMVSFDPARDDPAALTALAGRHELDARWTLASVPEVQVRELAAILDIPYRKLPSGDYNHGSIVTLLDREGRIVTKLEGSGADTAPMREALAALEPAS